MRNLTLQRLGITVWRKRHASASSDCFCCLLHNAANEPVGVIVADIEASEAAVADQEQLLRKIAQVMAPRGDVQVSSFPFLSALLTGSVRYVILLGARVNHHYDQQIPVPMIRAASLSTLLKEASEKQQLWAQLKPLIS